MQKIVGLLRPAPFLGYPIAIYAIVWGTAEGVNKLWHGDTYDYALAYGFGMGLSVVLGILAGTSTAYGVSAVVLRYLRSIRSHVDETMQLAGLDREDGTDRSRAPFLFRVLTWACIISTVAGAEIVWIAFFRLSIHLLVGFPEWSIGLVALICGLALFGPGVSVGLLQCYQLDRQAKSARRAVIAHLNENAVVEPVSDGAEVVTAMQTGEKFVGNLTGFRGGALITA